MIIGNYSAFNKTAGSFISGATIAQTRSNFNDTNKNRNFQTHVGKIASIPDGYGMNAWVPPQFGGGMASVIQSRPAISGVVNLAGGRNLVLPMSSVIIVTNAQLDQIVTFIASAVLQLAVTNAEMNASLVGIASGSMSISASNALLGAIIDILGNGTLILSPNTTLSATGYMEAHAGGPTALSPESLAAAVWEALSSDHISAGSMAKLIQDMNVDLAKKLSTGTFIALK